MGNYLSAPTKTFESKEECLKENNKNKNTKENKNMSNDKQEIDLSKKKYKTDNEIKENPFFFF